MRSISRALVAVTAIACLTGGIARAQSTTSTQAKTFEVIAVEGNALVVRLPEGTRQLTVPDDFRFTVNGTAMSLRELKPGMKGTASITTTTTTTPVTVTEVRNGTVQTVSGSAIVVRTEQGFRSFSQGDLDKRGVKIYKDGRPVALSELHTGDSLTATIVTTMPPKVVTQKEVQATLATAGGASAAPAASTASARSSSAATAAPSPASASSPAPGAAPARRLPKTAGSLVEMVLVGFTLLGIGAALSTHRRVTR
jgi:hypothetical protein